MAQVKKVKDINSRFMPDGREFWEILYEEGYPDNVYKEEQVAIFKQAFEAGKPVTIRKKQQEDKWFVDSVEIVGAAKATQPAGKAQEAGGKLPVHVERFGGESDTRSHEIAVNMWWKEVGEALRSGLADTNTPIGKILASCYFQKMYEVLGIDIKQVKKE